MSLRVKVTLLLERERMDASMNQTQHFTKVYTWRNSYAIHAIHVRIGLHNAYSSHSVLQFQSLICKCF